MKILTVEQLRNSDAYAINHEPISSDDLMERAANQFVNWFAKQFHQLQTVKIFCGVGNNGGDGLCIARLLYYRGYRAEVYIVRFSDHPSDDFKINERRLVRLPQIPIHNITADAPNFPQLNAKDILIDALFGSGLSRPIKGFTAEIVQKINQAAKKHTVLALDVPSGLYADKISDSITIKAHQTISFEAPKLSLLFPQNYEYVGEWCTVPVGLHKKYLAEQETNYYYITPKLIKSFFKAKGKFTHKGNNGHTLVIGGSYGKMGACVLMAKAALKAGTGLITAYVPRCGYVVMQTAFPEAMTITDAATDYISEIPSLQRLHEPDVAAYQSIAIGPGLGRAKGTQAAVLQLLQTAQQPLVLDADALNIIAQNDWWGHIPRHSILTPHPKEFARLAGTTDNDYDRLSRQKELAKKHQVYLILKGAHTCIATPEGMAYFNSSGTPALATAGSGDVLTGIIAGFLAQGYSPKESAILGVYFHGLAGEYAENANGNITASDIIAHFRV